MGDVYCEKCGEPWDIYEFGPDGCITKEEQKKFWAGEGCPSCTEETVEEYRKYKESFGGLDLGTATSVLHDALGDDIDGIVSGLQDLEFMYNG